MKIGYQKALSAIVDGNITTLIAAAVLAIKGSGSVKGFAQTLALGIVASVFTALVVSKLVMNALYALGMKDVKWYGTFKERQPINFVGKKKIWFSVSVLVIVAGLAYMDLYTRPTAMASCQDFLFDIRFGCHEDEHPAGLSSCYDRNGCRRGQEGCEVEQPEGTRCRCTGKPGTAEMFYEWRASTSSGRYDR